MSDIQIISNVRGYLDHSNTAWLNAEDVARGFGFTYSKDGVEYIRWERVNSYLESFGYFATRGENSQRVGKDDYLPENMVYRLGFKANNETAIKFQTILADEVLPSIRKHGAYATSQTIESIIADPANGIKLLQALQEERQLRRIAEDKAALEAEINIANAPKVLFADAVVGSKSTCLIGELAKVISQNGYPIGQNRLFKWLRENGYLGKYGERYNIPNQQYVEMGLFELKKNVHSENGVMKTTMTPKVTGKGQQYFINKFLAK